MVRVVTKRLYSKDDAGNETMRRCKDDDFDYYMSYLIDVVL